MLWLEHYLKLICSLESIIQNILKKRCKYIEIRALLIKLSVTYVLCYQNTQLLKLKYNK